MSKKEKDSAPAEEKKVITVDDVKKSVDALWGEFKKLVKVCERHFGDDMNRDGKVGNVRVAMLIVLLFASVSFASSTLWQLYDSDATKGTAKVVSDDAGAATMTVDAIAIKNWSIKGTNVTATADALNSGVASSTATLVSNALLKVYGLTYQIVNNGTFTAGTNVTFTLGASSTMSVPNGCLTVLALSTGNDIPANDGNAITNINAANVSGTYGAGSGAAITHLTWGNMDGVTATSQEVNRITVNTNLFVSSFSAVAVTNFPYGTTNTVTVTAKNWMGQTLTTNCIFHMWFAATDMGAPAALDTETLVTSGTVIQMVTTNLIYDVQTLNTGVAVLKLQNNAAETNYMMISSGGGVVTSTKLVWPLP